MRRKKINKREVIDVSIKSQKKHPCHHYLQSVSYFPTGIYCTLSYQQCIQLHTLNRIMYFRNYSQNYWAMDYNFNICTYMYIYICIYIFGIKMKEKTISEWIEIMEKWFIYFSINAFFASMECSFWIFSCFIKHRQINGQMY